MINIPLPRQIDRTKISYLSSGPIDIPLPRPIDRSLLLYSSEDGLIRVPKPHLIVRENVERIRPQLTVLEKNIASPVTPGEQFFPPFEVTSALEQEAARRIAQYPAEERRSAVLPLLHAVQHKFGFISPESIDWVAKQLDIEPIKVVEVVTFYPGFRQKAPGKLHVRVCRTLSCAMGGSYELMDKLCELTKIDRAGADGHKDPISVSPCGNFSVEFAECLASCGTAPVCLVNDDFHEGVSAEKAEALLDSYQNA
ncbi:NAD(P)H-dependent oxidoreductase subunit E [Akkermansiaceae bacterium]|nr:NAD(P)H-dependent oxidoreductase subunit E [Akkermansiaceae bacterium]